MKYTIYSLFFLALLVIPFRAHAQSVGFDVAASYALEEVAPVTVTFDSEGRFVNALEFRITYPAELIEIIDISTQDSIIDLWVSKPRVSGDEIILIGGITGGAVVKDVPLVTVTARMRKAGDARFALDVPRSHLYANDGFGTELQLTAASVSFEISQQVFQPDIRIESSTHPEEYTWYQARDVRLAWDAGLSDWSYSFGKNSRAAVDQTADIPTGEVIFEQQEDGIYYFLLRRMLEPGVWSHVTTRRVQIDGTPPRPFEVSRIDGAAQFGGNPVLVFDTTDDTSGVDLYEISEDGNTYTISRSPVELRDENARNITVTAIDRAGNKQSTSLVYVESRQSWLWLVGLGVAILLVFAALIRRRYQRKRRS